MSQTPIRPFAEDASSREIAGLTVENGATAIAVYGQCSLTRDKDGLGKAQALLDFAQAVVAALQADPALPAKVPAAKPKGAVKNPFS